MKMMTKLLLINWHYFEKEIIEFSNINFLTGRNSAGKSTIIDALQVVLMGETRSSGFNRAASKKSERTLKSYLIGSKGEDINSGKQSVRGGKDFTTYIVAEIYDDIKNEFFCLGAVFDSYADGGDEKRRFFYLKSKLPQNCFIVDNLAMDIKQVTAFFKEEYPNRYETKDTNDAYKDIILRKTYVFDKKMFAMLKKAISFEPINDIEKFITDNVCDIEDDINIETMQENILYYKQQEQIAAKFEEKLMALENICNIYAELEKRRTLYTNQRFLIDYAKYQDYCTQLKKAYADSEKYDEDIAEFTQKYSQLEEKINMLNKEKDKLTADREDYWRNQNGDKLKNEEKHLEDLIVEANSKINDFVRKIKSNAIKWNEILTNASYEKCFETFADELKTVLDKLARLEKLTEAGLDDLSIEYFTKTREKFRFIIAELSTHNFEINEQYKKLQNEAIELETSIFNLKKGIKQYPIKAQQLKQAIYDGLAKKYDKNIQVMFFADLIEVTDEQWHDAVEGYLNTQRMNIFVEPEYFMDAYEIYKQVHKGLMVHEYRVVDSQKVYLANKNVVSNSLACVVKSKNKYVSAYIEYLLGKVTCCYDDAKIRDNKISVTQKCMSYSGYTVGPLNQNAYLNPYIGQNSIATQIKTKTSELQQLNDTLAQMEMHKKAIAPIIETEWFLTESYISSTVANVFDLRTKKIVYKSSLDEIQMTISKLDFFWIDEMNNKIKIKESEIKNAYNEKESTAKFIDEFNREKKNKVLNVIPALVSASECAKETISTSFSKEFIENTGIPNYNRELHNRQTAAKIVLAFEPRIKGTETQIAEKISDLVQARSEYNRNENVSFNISDNQSNVLFSDEYNKIKDYELPKYTSEIDKAKTDAMEQFKSDFLYKLKSNIETTNEKIAELNKALKSGKFGDDSYRFVAKPNPAYSEYYEMIMSDSLSSGSEGLFSCAFLDRYQSTIDNLFLQIINFGSEIEGNSAQNVKAFSEYKTYLSFDMQSTDLNGKTISLAASMTTTSGGETQTPFYIAILATFAQLYRVNDTSEYGNTFRLVIFDEAFNKMDSARITQSIKLLKKLNLQAIICSPPEKAEDIALVSDKTLLVVKENYKSMVLEWKKEMGELADEI